MANEIIHRLDMAQVISVPFPMKRLSCGRILRTESNEETQVPGYAMVKEGS
jgi:hypothetical protein